MQNPSEMARITTMSLRAGDTTPFPSTVRALTMPNPIFPSRSLALAFAAVIVLFEQYGITLAQTPGTTPTSPESKMDAKITQLQKTDTLVGTGAEVIPGKIAVV